MGRYIVYAVGVRAGLTPSSIANPPYLFTVFSFTRPAVSPSWNCGCHSIVVRRFFALLAALHDVPAREENAFQSVPPHRLLPEQELEIHPEVLHLLLLGVLHDRLRLFILLQRDALLVPPDRLGFLGQRRDHAREGAGAARELVRRLVVLVETHGGVLV